MPRQAASFLQGSLARGLVTEANPLRFPEDAATAADNVRFERPEQVTRRKGFDFETNYTTFTSSSSNNEAITEYLWEAVAGDGERSFVVVQQGNFLHYYEVDSTGNVSGDKQAFTTDLTSYIPTNGSEPLSKQCQFVDGLGKLIVVNENINPIVVTFTPNEGDPSNLVDGGFSNNNNDAIKFEAGADVTDQWIKFDYGSGNTETVTELVLSQSTTDSHGTWKFQGSNNDSDWTDIGSSFTLGGSAVQVITEPSANATAYRYYRLLGVSGTASGTPFIQEIRLRTNSSVTTVLDSDTDRRSRITVTDTLASGDETGSSDGVTALVDGNSSTKLQLNNSGTFNTSDTIVFDFGYAASTVIDEIQFEIDAVGSDNIGSWKMQGSNDNSSYSDIGSSFTISGSDGTFTISSMSGNTTGYRYYRLIGVSPNAPSNDLTFRSMVFQRADLYDIGDLTGSITVTDSGEIFDPGTLSVTEIDIKTRDFAGVEDGREVDERPTSNIAGLSADELYNRYNQGWYPGFEDPLSTWDSGRSDMPSNADIWWLAKDGNASFSVSWIDRIQVGNRPAPKGHYILSEFNKDRNQDSVESTTSDTITAQGDETTVERPSTVEFFAGRVWYSGVDAGGFNNRLYFSQVIQTDDQFEKCYQFNDPTNETIADLLDTDGGVIVIPDAGTIINLAGVNNVLLVFASNGIWTISGSSGAAFKATDFSVEKISDINITSPLSFVKVKDTPLWWSEDGIYTAQFNQDFSGLNVRSISEQTVQETFDDIGATNKLYVKGAYCSCDKEVHWLYNSSSSLSADDFYKYDKVLTLNIETGAFSSWTIQSGVPEVRGLVPVKGSNLTIAPVFKYLTTWDSSGDLVMTFSEEKNTSYTDWATYATDIGSASDEKDYDSTFTTGYRLDSDGQRTFNTDYVHVFSERESGAGALVQAIRDFSIDESSGKETVRQQIYSDDSTRKVIDARLKVRGSGKALQLKFHSEAGKPFTILGWGIYETSNARV